MEYAIELQIVSSCELASNSSNGITTFIPRTDIITCPPRHGSACHNGNSVTHSARPLQPPDVTINIQINMCLRRYSKQRGCPPAVYVDTPEHLLYDEQNNMSEMSDDLFNDLSAQTKLKDYSRDTISFEIIYFELLWLTQAMELLIHPKAFIVAFICARKKPMAIGYSSMRALYLIYVV